MHIGPATVATSQRGVVNKGTMIPLLIASIIVVSLPNKPSVGNAGGAGVER